MSGRSGMMRRVVIVVLAAQGIALIALEGAGRPSLLTAFAGAHLVAVAGYLRRSPWGPKLAAVLATVALLVTSWAIVFLSTTSRSDDTAPFLLLLGLVMASYAIVLAGSLREIRFAGRAARVRDGWSEMADPSKLRPGQRVALTYHNPGLDGVTGEVSAVSAHRVVVLSNRTKTLVNVALDNIASAHTAPDRRRGQQARR